MMPPFGKKSKIILAWGAALVVLAAGPVAAERPKATRLLPKNTLACLHVPDCQNLADKFQQTALGRIAHDEQIRPLISQLYGEAQAAFGQIENRLGVSLDELLNLPQGELCLAAVAPEEGRPQFVAIVDVSGRVTLARKLIEGIEEQLVLGGADRSVESAGDIEITLFKLPGQGRRAFAFFIKDDAVFVTTSLQLSQEIAGLLEKKDDKVETLADNSRFQSIMKRCRDDENEPQLTWYVDPVEFYTRAAQGDARTRAVAATLPIIGLDGLYGVGGSMVFAAEEFDSIIHAHVLLDETRTGVLEMLALEAGDTTPERWVPHDVASYTTLHWNFEKTINIVEDLYDSFNGPDAMALAIEDAFTGRLEIDFRKDFVEQLDGRATYITWMERPARVNSQANLVALKVKDESKARRVLDRTMAKFSEQFRRETFAGVSYYHRSGGNNGDGDRGDNQSLVRRPEPCLAVVGDYVMATDSPSLLREVLTANRKANGSLAKNLEFKLISSKLSRQPGGAKPGLLTFNRPEEQMRLWYDLATGGAVSSRAENNGFFRALNGALNDNPLPPFAVIAQYLSPGGSLVTNNVDGFHYTNFTLRRK